ncbi:TIGR01777 family oxidoreductase [Gallaecimonas sp. GXIMD4217]|uniref:TIGR01777 family oxidoreductase n=1 Tax=Gallaecimonas sp. GXIMD4217 TaxID=3131927 RepID=UPI00311B05E4
MKPKLLITGGTGFIGQALIPTLCDWDITVLSRSREKTRSLFGESVAWVGNVPELSGFDAVINLAGEPIADKRWTKVRKQRICQSRWQLTEELVQAIARAEQPPRVLISGSAIGYYGAQPSTTSITEEFTQPHDEFAHRLCERWEALAKEAMPHCRVCLLRTGLVLDQGGGALKKMLPAFRLGLGGRIGDGEQIMSWIHRDDMVAIIRFLLEHDELSGAFNCTAPFPVSNQAFAKALGHALHRPALLPVPAPALRLMLGEMSELLLTGQKVIPARLLAAGFQHRYPRIEEALQASL